MEHKLLRGKSVAAGACGTRPLCPGRRLLPVRSLPPLAQVPIWVTWQYQEWHILELAPIFFQGNLRVVFVPQIFFFLAPRKQQD